MCSSRMISDTRIECQDENNQVGRASRGPPAGGPGEKVKPGGAGTSSVDVVVLLQRSGCGTDLPAFRHQPADLLSLEAALRPPRAGHAGRAFASASPGTPADLGAGYGAACSRTPHAISALGQGQTGGAAAPREMHNFDIDGRTHSRTLETARRAARAASSRGPAHSAAQTAQASVGHSEA